MNRTIPIAGALAAALGSMLSLAPAQAQEPGGTCYFDNLGGSLPGTPCTGYSVELGDKLFSVVTAPTSGVGKVDWTVNPASTLWQADIDWDGNGMEGPQAGRFQYTTQITSGFREFQLVGLGSDGFQPTGLDTTLNKKVYAGLAPSGTPIADLTTKQGGNVFSAISGTQIFVSDTWELPAGNTLDNLINYQTQTVPGPLPVLGAVAALGFGRRMRRRLAAAGS